MMTPEELKAHVESALPEAKLSLEKAVLVVEPASLTAVMRLLKTDAALRLDFLANLCATDWLPKKQKVKEGEVEVEREVGGHLEVVYHLYSVALRHGPVVVKCRTADRKEDARMPSVTPIWRGAEYQEREAYDLYGVIFEGHPDLRRILTWDELEDFPMRKDYRPPDDYEWEPTPHGDIVDHVRALQAAAASGNDAKDGKDGKNAKEGGAA
jgi:NADH-quinone oxidoreductase subunit C